MPLFSLRPGFGIQLGPIIPAFLGRERREMITARPGIEGFWILAHFGKALFEQTSNRSVDINHLLRRPRSSAITIPFVFSSSRLSP